MVLRVKSTQVQQEFGEAMDQAFSGSDLIVERYGNPRVAIINYRRYEQLLEAERQLLRHPVADGFCGGFRAGHKSQRCRDRRFDRASAPGSSRKTPIEVSHRPIRVVIDTNVFIRYLLRPSAAIRRLIEDLWLEDQVLVVSAPELFQELSDVLGREAIQALILSEDGLVLLEALQAKAELVPSLGEIPAYTRSQGR